MTGKKNTKAKNANELDVSEFFAAVAQLEKDRGIPRELLIEKISRALLTAYRRDHAEAGSNMIVDANEETGQVRMFLRKDVVETVDDPKTEISLEEARAKLPRAQLGDVISIEVKPRNFGRVAAQAARQVIVQGIKEAERSVVYDRFSDKIQEIVTATVTRIDPWSGSAIVRITNRGESTDAYLAPTEQIRGETLSTGDRIKVYVMEVNHANRGSQVLVSRTHPGLVKRLFELEVPEVFDGTVEIKSIAREAGSRSKMAVWSEDPQVDPIGACVGTRSARISNIVEELKGEKIDLIRWSEDPAEFIAAALAPATVISVDILSEEDQICLARVPFDQLSLAIGREGQNARLAARLTGWKIDVRSETDPVESEEPAPQE